MITHPEGYELDPKFVGNARVEYDQMKAFEGADFVYADVYKRQIYKKLDDAIQAVGKAEGVVYIFDLARTPIPFV